MSATPSRPPDDADLGALLSRGARELAMPLAQRDVDRLIAYVRLIERWNATYNLTAVRAARDMVTQHVLDCLAAAAALGRRRGTGDGERVADVGSGAGLPGLVIAMTFPARQVVCVDAVGKKTAFITQAAATLGLKNVTAVHGRVENLQDTFDVIASRAFAALNEFVAATAHLLKDSGSWMAMKGKTPTAELAVLNAKLTFYVEPLVVPGLAAERCLVWIERSEASARS